MFLSWQFAEILQGQRCELQLTVDSLPKFCMDSVASPGNDASYSLQLQLRKEQKVCFRGKKVFQKKFWEDNFQFWEENTGPKKKRNEKDYF